MVHFEAASEEPLPSSIVAEKAKRNFKEWLKIL